MPQSTGSPSISSTAQIGDGVIVDADVNASAAIAWTKISKSGSNITDIATRAITDMTGQLLPANGGTGLATLTANNLLVGAGTSNVTFIAPGANNTVLKSNGTTATFGSAPFAISMIMGDIITAVTRYAFTAIGTGTNTYTALGAKIATGATATSAADLVFSTDNQGTVANLFANSPKMSFNLRVSSANGANGGDSFFGIGNVTVTGSAITFAPNHIGFELRKVSGTTSLYGTTGNGSSAFTAALTTVVVSDILELCFLVNGTTSVDFYWRKNGSAWSSATNLASNVPTTTTGSGIIRFAVSNVDTAEDFQIHINSWSYER